MAKVKWVTPIGHTTAHATWSTRRGLALMWCLDICKPVRRFRVPAPGDVVCRTCFDQVAAVAS